MGRDVERMAIIRQEEGSGGTGGGSDGGEACSTEAEVVTLGTVTTTSRPETR